MSIILGIDPGTTTVGFGVLEKTGSRFSILDFGVISTPPKIALADKLLEITDDLRNLLETYRPEVCGIETLLFTTNRKTGIAVAQARGAILTEIARKGIRTVELGPMQVKRGICGNGRAPKTQVQNALKLLFKLDAIPKPDDAADALAIAYVAGLAKAGGISA
jgi:crossover junction endodeoxyribonuclease RuvC